MIRLTQFGGDLIAGRGIPARRIRRVMRRIFAATLLAAIVIGGTRQQMLAALKPSWRTSRQRGISVGLSQVPLRFARDPMPEAFVDFFKHVEKAVPIGGRIAVVAPPPWDSRRAGYSRFRIEYL